MMENGEEFEHPDNLSDEFPQYVLRLFVAGGSLNSTRAIANLKSICTQHLAGRYTLEVIDVREDREIAEREQLVALPLLIKDKPEPVRRLVGDMSDVARVLRGLGIKQ